jgi:hypothetical protein
MPRFWLKLRMRSAHQVLLSFAAICLFAKCVPADRRLAAALNATNRG